MTKLELSNYSEFKDPERLIKLKPLEIRKRELEKKISQIDSSKKSEIGWHVGNLIYDELELRLSKKDKLNEDDKKAIRGIVKFYDKLLKYDKLLATVNGFVAEFAMGKAVHDVSGFAVYKSTKDEDLYEKIDSWVSMEGSELKLPERDILAVQVKCFSKMDDMVFADLRNKDEIDNFFQLHNYIFYDEERKRKLRNQIAIQKMNTLKYENTIPILLVLPSLSSSSYEKFYSGFGEPSRYFGVRVNDEIERRFFQEVYDEERS